jgi:hypothetical protein
LCADVGRGGAGSVRFVAGDALGDALVRSGGVVVHLVFGQDGTQVCLAEIRTRPGSSRCKVAMRRPQVAFMRGAWTAVRRIVAPVAWKTASKERVKFDPRPPIKNLMSSNRSPGSRRGCGPAARSTHRWDWP